MSKLQDKKIVELALEDPDKYKYLVERYEKKLLNYIKGLLYVSHEDAEDILQEAFLKAYKNLHSFNPKYKFSSWIFRITHNEAISFIRKNKYKKMEFINNPENDILEEISSDLDLEKELIKKDTKIIMNKALSNLDVKYRDVLILKFLEEMDYNEISEVLHIPPGTVGSLINRAKAKLRDIISSDGKIK